MGLARKRHHRDRVIRKRMRIIDAQNGGSPIDGKKKEPWVEHEGQLAKFNLACGCDMCTQRTERKLDNKRRRRLGKMVSKALID